MMNYRTILLIGAIFAGLAVALGAFGAHGLRSMVSASQLETFQTGVRYQMYHALALLFLGVLMRDQPANSLFSFTGWGWLVGILLFSGSLYAITLGVPRILGIITPLGGVAFLSGWVCAILAIFNLKHT